MSYHLKKEEILRSRTQRTLKRPSFRRASPEECKTHNCTLCGRVPDTLIGKVGVAIWSANDGSIDKIICRDCVHRLVMNL